jgi:FkbM family methyltransferase
MWGAAGLYYVRKKLGHKSIRLRRQGITMIVGSKFGEGSWQGISGLDYEPELRQILARVKEGDIILDIGANIGSYTLRLAKKAGLSGRVIAFEALEKNARLLQANIEANHLTNVTVVNKALGESSGLVTMYSDGHSSSASLMQVNAFQPSGQTEMVRGDDIVEELKLPRIDWIKIDIEGAETIALRGLRHTIARFKPRILFENARAAEETRALLQGLGYLVGVFDAHDQLQQDLGQGNFGNLFAIPRELA